MLPGTQRPSKFKLRYETRVDKLQKKQAASHTHIPSRRTHTIVGTGLHKGGGGGGLASLRLDEDATVAMTGIARTC
jgi:hypothetical protein